MTVRVGFLGGGFIAQYHASMLALVGDEAAIVAVHDPDPTKAASFHQMTKAAVLSTEDAVIEASDAVYVTTWTAEHPRLVRAAAAAGKPVFCEKPLATTLAEAVDMVDAVGRAGVINQVGLVLRDSPSCNLLRYLVNRPQSGRLMSVVFRDDQFIPIQGMYASSWRSDPALAGAGTLLEHSIHDLDLLEWILGPITEVSARSREFHGIAGIEDVTVASFSFANGGLGSLTSVWHDVLARPSTRRIEVFCENAFYVLEGDVHGPVRWTVEGGDGIDGDLGAEGMIEGPAVLAALHARGIRPRNPDKAFIRSVVSGAPAQPGFEDALRAHVLAEVIYRSAGGSAEVGGGAALTVPVGLPGAARNPGSQTQDL